jgi:hypothetical protein
MSIALATDEEGDPMVLTVCYNGQFWIAVVEVTVDGQLRAARHVFGSSEPGDPVVDQFVQRDLLSLLGQADLGTAAPAEPIRRVNAKRLAREVARTMAQRGPSTKAQEALKEALSERRAERRAAAKAEREAEAERRYALRRAKAKAKHRGH